MREAISSGTGGMLSWVIPVVGDQTRFTWRSGFVSGWSLRLWQPRVSRRSSAASSVARAARAADLRSNAWARSW